MIASPLTGVVVPPRFNTVCHLQGDYNIIMVNWELAADNINYFRSKMDSRLVARELAVLLKKLHEHPGLDLDYANVHLVGHSLGAHLAGYTGDFLQGQIGHITGKDI